MNYRKLITSESVAKGHPDKICDQISDAILDQCLKLDRNAKVACEVFASNHLIVIGGEISTTCYIDLTKIAWGVLAPLGYSENDFTIISNVNSQSSDIKQAVDKKTGEIGAGDQGIVYGYATNETANYMPLSLSLAHDLVKLAEKLRVEKKFKWAKTDMKSQVTIDYTDEHHLKIDTMLMSIQHDEKYNALIFKKYVEKNIMEVIAKKYRMNTNYKTIINPSGRFVVGGPIGDTGLTGRKIIVDTYGGVSRHGGGAFSGKDPSKVDRSGAYFARYVAKNIVAAGLCDRCEIQIAFGIGLTTPIAIMLETFNTNKVPEELIVEIINKVFDFTVKDMIEHLKLKNTNYQSLATFGHMGREDLNVSWEKLDKVKEIKNLLKENGIA